MKALRDLTRTAARFAGALGLTLAALGATTAPAAADPQAMGRCTTTSGAVLAVDFSHWGGPILRSCGTTPTTGYELLNQGGWRTVGTGHDGPAFICRISYSGYKNGTQHPTAREDNCVLTPPASAYWSYWHADPGQNDWEYSQLGAMLYKPKPGSVDLWTFGATNIEGTQGRPTVTPDQLRAHNTEPQGDAGKPASTAKAPTLPPGTDTGPVPVTKNAKPSKATPTPKPTPKHTTSPTPSAPSTSPTPSPDPSPSSAPAGITLSPSPSTRVVDAAPAADASYDAGSFVPLIAGGGLAALIVGAAVVSGRRRHRSE
ncbi:hypothetical protein ABZ479_19695 [Streptomyces sp. NPDC005722]